GGDLVEDLIHQFSDPFAFYRELIQNAIDAGSPTIRIVVRFEGGGPRGVASGVAQASVEDAGCGMDREIIEKFLLTLFRSSKEGDLTKIGKFGIGFVSVFAPAPQLVVVETGKDGESWRVILHPDRTYDLYRGEAPRIGTKVTLHKEMDAGGFRAFVKSSREAVARWCRHSEEAEVTFAAGGDDGAPPRPPENVRQPFTVDAPVIVEWSKGDTRVVAGPA